MSPSAHILVVATKDVQEPIGQTLRHDGYAVSSTDSCAEAIQSIEEAAPDIVVLHARLGGGRTGATLMELAEARGVPVLVLGRRDGLDEPGYLRRDVNRVRRLVASHLSTTSSTGQLEVGEVTVDTVHHVACVGQRSLDLTRKEFELLCHLVRRPGWTWTRQQLLEQVWGYDLADPRVVTVHVGNLRRKLAQAARGSARAPGTSPLPRQAFIQTVKGVGYRYARLEQAAGAATTTVAAQPSRPAHPPRSPFLGRENEMAILEQSLDDALGGCVQTVVLAGDALPTMGNYLKKVPPALHTDRNLALASMVRIMGIADIVVPGHDLPFSLRKDAYVALPFQIGSRKH